MGVRWSHSDSPKNQMLLRRPARGSNRRTTNWNKSYKQAAMPYLPKSSLVPFPDVSSILHASQQVKWFWQNNILFAALGPLVAVAWCQDKLISTVSEMLWPEGPDIKGWYNRIPLILSTPQKPWSNGSIEITHLWEHLKLFSGCLMLGVWGYMGLLWPYIITVLDLDVLARWIIRKRLDKQLMLSFVISLPRFLKLGLVVRCRGWLQPAVGQPKPLNSLFAVTSIWGSHVFDPYNLQVLMSSGFVWK